MKLSELASSEPSIEFIPATLPLQYRIVPAIQVAPHESKTGILYLHGYQDNGISFFKRLYGLSGDHVHSTELDHFSHLIPHAPYPVPVRTETGWKEAYSWYFFNEKKNQMLIGPDAAAHGLEKILRMHSEAFQNLSIVCFSQGGYLLPWLLKHFLKSGLAQKIEIQNLVGIATGYDHTGFPAQDQWAGKGLRIPRLLAIHPEKDPIFQIDKVQAGLAQVKSLGYETEWVIEPGLDHRVSESVGQKVTKFLSS